MVEKWNQNKELSFAELKQRIDSTKPVTKLPTAKALLAGESPIVATKTMTDGSRLTVFQNGFALFQTSRFYTVIRVDQCGDYTYHSRTGPICLSAEYFADEPWGLRVQLEAENRIVHNQESYEGNKIRSKYQFMPWSVEKTQSTDFSEEIDLWDEAKERLARLTKKQRRGFILYYCWGYTHAEIAAMLGVTKSAVTHLLAEARKRIDQ